MGLVARALLTRDGEPDYVEVKAPKQELRAGLRAYLGSIPDYAEEVKGVKLAGVTKGAPADKAGLKQGDIIVELAGRKIENIYDYTYAIEALKIGQEVDIVVERGGQRMTLKLTPGSRE
jgi:S1-C subfamily serine protease